MRILFFIDALSAGGKERRLIELMKGLKTRPGIDFELVIFSSTAHFKEVFDLGITIHHVVRRTRKDVLVFKKIYTICRNYKPDFVHCWDSMSAVYLLPASKLLNIKLVNGMVTDAPGKTGFRNASWLRARITFPFSKIIIGNSQAGLAAYNAPGTKSICIRNGFNFGRLKAVIPAAITREALRVTTRYVVGMVASFSKFKDYNTYFAATQMILKKRNDVTFIAIGNDTDSIEARNLVDKQYEAHFKLLGKKSDVESLINCMDVCVLATFTEGISNSILEYMALGKPVVATSGGGTNEIVEDNITGFLVSAGNPVMLSEKIEILLNDDRLRKSMGEAGKLRVHHDFSIDKMVDEFIVNYKKLSAIKR